MGKPLSLILTMSVTLILSVIGFSDPVPARIRVFHATPDVPALDVWVDDSLAFSSFSFKGITDYFPLEPGTYTTRVAPTGSAEPVVTEVDVPLRSKHYTIAAVGTAQSMEQMVLVDDTRAAPSGKARVRFVHVSPEVPPLDVFVGGGMSMFNDIAFKGVADYLTVDAGTYELQVRVTGTDSVVLTEPGITLADGEVYTIFALGLLGGETALAVFPYPDVQAATVTPETGREISDTVRALVAVGFGVAFFAGAILLGSQLGSAEDDELGYPTKFQPFAH
jgi:hypothetical protein